MATSVHIPKLLLDAVDRRAQALRISRNRLIVKALERELAEGEDWSAGFFEQLSAVDEATAGAIDKMLADVRARRQSKAPRRL
jgi:metal-responsive CopG/Arc/MetJ family transcriptional regulator